MVSRSSLVYRASTSPWQSLQVRYFSTALVGFQGRGFADGVQPDFCHSLFLEALIFQ